MMEVVSQIAAALPIPVFPPSFFAAEPFHFCGFGYNGCAAQDSSRSASDSGPARPSYLFYPKSIPGEHETSGPIDNFTGPRLHRKWPDSPLPARQHRHVRLPPRHSAKRVHAERQSRFSRHCRRDRLFRWSFHFCQSLYCQLERGHALPCGRNRFRSYSRTVAYRTRRLAFRHRDLKPENILHNKTSGKLTIADFGIAQLTEDLVATLVETAPSQRLANFQYALQSNGSRAYPLRYKPIYALGLILNELFTGLVPHGTQYRQIVDVDVWFGFLDPLIARMLSQEPSRRPDSIAEIKMSIQRYREDAVFAAANQPN